MVTTEALPEEVTERQATGGDFVSVLVPTKAAPSSSFLSHGKTVDPTDIQSGPSVEMMSSVEVPKLRPLLGLLGLNFPLLEYYFLPCHPRL